MADYSNGVTQDVSVKQKTRSRNKSGTKFRENPPSIDDVLNGHGNVQQNGNGESSVPHPSRASTGSSAMQNGSSTARITRNNSRNQEESSGCGVITDSADDDVTKLTNPDAR